ncbi:MAG TPA: carbamoyl-phosphate synthase large subunit, partial [Candidatus Thermoplasmatota archaeon]|nr:carbamoyl-phosphate synthase large subunit [Candidatus Thermoplasmatota archaeon]
APTPWDDAKLAEAVEVATHQRLFAVAEALRRGWGCAKVHDLSGYDPFFLEKIDNVLRLERQLVAKPGDAKLLARAKRWGFSDPHVARLWGWGEDEARVGVLRRANGIVPDFKMVDTCAAEFEAKTPYYYTTYEPTVGRATDSTETTERSGSAGSAQSVAGAPSGRKKRCLVLGSGPIRIGQGIEFDYCCVHAAWAIKEEGMEALLLNNNPETVSTDFDTSDRLYFDPLTLEDVLHVIERERPDGVLVQFGGQTAINLALPLEAALAARPDLPTKVWGTSPHAIDLAENREKFNALMQELGIPQPDAGIAFEGEEAIKVATRIGYPVLVRPSYVLGGRAMMVVHNEEELRDYVRDAVRVSKKHPLLVDQFLGRAIEIDVDAVCDGEDVLIGAIMEHVEEAGVHSGDSTTVIPPQNIPAPVLKTLEEYTRKIALGLGTRGLINIQYAVRHIHGGRDGKQKPTVYVLEANPRSSRTVPYVAKATGLPLAKIAAKVAIGRKLADLKVERPAVRHVAVKAPVFPFLKLPGVDAVLGPEMKSTGEVMGIADDYPLAYAKAMEAAGNPLPIEGTVFVSVAREDRARVLDSVKRLGQLGFKLFATEGTANDLRAAGLEVTTVYKLSDRKSPDAIDLLRRGEIDLIVNTPSRDLEAPQKRDGFQMRRVAVECQIPFLATIEAAQVAVGAIAAKRSLEVTPFPVRSLQDYAKAGKATKVPAR